MFILKIILVALVLLLLLFFYCACKISGDISREEEKYYRNMSEKE